MILPSRPTATSAAVVSVDFIPLYPSSLVTSYRFASPSSAGNVEEEFEYDPMAGVQHDAAVATAAQSLDTILNSLLPEGAPPAVATKVRGYLTQHPIDALIVADAVQITHVENPETGVEEKTARSPVSLTEALEQSACRRMHLVQMGSRDGTAFCRIRNEQTRINALIEAEMAAYVEQQQSLKVDPHRGRRTKELVDHVFRDAVDAHFISWKSKKICEDIKRGHPVKLTIRDFQSVDAAIYKLREMCNAMKEFAEREKISHHFTSIVTNDREASITLSPATANKSGTVSNAVRHPNEKEWESALVRMQAAMMKSGRQGTYIKNRSLKPRNVGATLYRTDKYGRRVD